MISSCSIAKPSAFAPHDGNSTRRVSLSLGYDPEEPWLLWVEGTAGAAEFRITRGAVLYKGTEIAHWSEEFQGNDAAQVFIHYVDQQGPYREWRFDKREAALNQSNVK